MDFNKIGLDLAQDLGFEILLAAILALLTRHLIDNEKLAVMLINILCACFFEITVSAKVADFIFHDVAVCGVAT